MNTNEISGKRQLEFLADFDYIREAGTAGEEKAAEEFNRMNENLRDSAFKAQCLSGLMMPIMNFIGNFGYVARLRRT